MMRVTTWRQNGTAPDNTPPTAAVEAFNEVVAALKKVPGSGDLSWGFGHGGIVTVGHPSNYAVADAILNDPGVQAAVAKVFVLGIAIDEDYFVSSAEQVMPFIPQQ